MSFLFGSEKSSTSIPKWIQKPAQDNIARAEQIAALGYTPYSGPDVAAFTPMQNAAFDGTNQAASAFGMPTAQGNGMPPPQTFAGGVQGYSSMPMYEQAVEALKTKNPAQYAALMQVLQQFQPAQPQSAAGQIVQQMASQGRRPGADTWGDDGGRSMSLSGIGSYAPGGVNTRNPGSLVNRTAASLTSRTQSAPTSANRPQARPK